MRVILRPLAVAALATFTLLAAAASEAPAAADAVQRVEIIGPSPALSAALVVLSNREVDATYRMSTGHRMSVSAVGDGVRMRYGRRQGTLLRHDGHGSFVSANGALALQFELDAHGDPQAVRLSMPIDWL